MKVSQEQTERRLYETVVEIPQAQPPGWELRLILCRILDLVCLTCLHPTYLGAGCR